MIINSSHNSIFVIYCYLTTLYIIYHYTANTLSVLETATTPETSFTPECLCQGQCSSNKGPLIGVTVVAVTIFLISLLIIVLLLLKLRLVICFN